MSLFYNNNKEACDKEYIEALNLINSNLSTKGYCDLEFDRNLNTGIINYVKKKLNEGFDVKEHNIFTITVREK